MISVALELGASNTVAAAVDGGRPRVVPLKGGARTLPSAVALDERGRWLVGRDARAQRLTRPADTVVGMKTLMGRSPGSTVFRQQTELLSYRIAEGSEGPEAVLGDRRLPLVEAAAMVLREVRGQAQDNLGQEIRSAVLPVPDYFTDEQRQALADAAYRADVEKVFIIDESEALIRLLKLAGRGAGQHLVFLYGLGGGVFDATVLERSPSGKLDVIATTGEDLGGVHFDRRVAGWLHEQFVRTHGLGAFSEATGLQRILEAAEAAKVRLDEGEETPVSLPFLATGEGNAPLDLSCVLGRGDLVRLTGDLVRRTLAISQSVLRAARVEPAQIDAVYVYGRSTRAREVLAATSRFFGRTPVRLPDDASVLGAAAFAAGR